MYPTTILVECQLLLLVSLAWFPRPRHTTPTVASLDVRLPELDRKLDYFPASIILLLGRIEVVHPDQRSTALRALSCVFRGEPTGDADVGALVAHLHPSPSLLGAEDSNFHHPGSEPSILPIRRTPNALTTFYRVVTSSPRLALTHRGVMARASR